MRIVMFYHSLVSDWNHGNAHFLRGVATELIDRGHEVLVYEPLDAWSRVNLESEHGASPIREFRRYYPRLVARFYHPELVDLDEVLAGADLVLVHEWNAHTLVQAIGEHRARHGYTLLFHDTHHRSVTEPAAMEAYDLSGYDGVLAFGNVIRDLYLRRKWARRAWTWHEAADVRVFRSLPRRRVEGDLVWVGNWGDDERTAELRTFLIEPVRALRLKATVYGVRYPEHAIAALADAGIAYRGWLPNYLVPDVFSRYRLTVHVPRRPYVEALPGIPTIRPFEALACGIPLICSPWDDREGLFRSGQDYLVAHDGREMQQQMRQVLDDRAIARSLARSGRESIEVRHTCAHRVDQLLAICSELQTAGVQTRRVAG